MILEPGQLDLPTEFSLFSLMVFHWLRGRVRLPWISAGPDPTSKPNSGQPPLIPKHTQSPLALSYWPLYNTKPANNETHLKFIKLSVIQHHTWKFMTISQSIFLLGEREDLVMDIPLSKDALYQKTSNNISLCLYLQHLSLFIVLLV